MLATVTKTKSAEPAGTYQRTALDDRKAAATILVTAVYRSTYDVTSKVALSGRGVKHYGGDRYNVTRKVLDRLMSLHTWATDY